MKNKILVKQILKLQAIFQEKTQEELKNILFNDKKIVNRMASIREIIKRNTGLELYPVQILGALELFNNKIIEMKTGEGKTVVALAAALLKNSYNKKVHIVTVNEYLAERDANFAKDAYQYIDKRCDYILSTTDNKKDIYQNSDLIYITNSELGFDYLRSNGCYGPEDIVFNNDNAFAIIDEADSILIDEARIPLILSINKDIELENYKKAQYFVKTLKKDEYEIDMKDRIASLNEKGATKCQKYFNLADYSSIEAGKVRHLVNEALIANFIMKKDIDYIIKDNEVKLIDTNTGRVAEGRRFNKGLHQAIEAKENKEIKTESSTVGSITYQKLFKMYEDFAGMTGTAMTEKQEFKEIYNKKPIEIPSNKPLKRIDAKDLIFSNNTYRDEYLIKTVKENNQKQRPILIGTASIVESERIAKLFTKNGIKFNLLNAKNDKNEAEIIAKAGQKGAVTIATNMAGRGTDIKLGEGVVELGGLMILGIGHYDFERIDNQLRGRAGRQGDPGYSQFLVSIEDKIIDTFAGDTLKTLMSNLAQETGYATNKGFSKGIKRAQNAIANSYFNSRKSTTEYDDILGLYRSMFYIDRMKVLNSSDDELLTKFTSDETILSKVRKQLKREAPHRARTYILAVMDNNWIDFLTIAEDLKMESGYNSYSGTKSIVLYENELGNAYSEMLQNISETILKEFKKIQ
jgi:preprotein translocase subunit SecA